MDEERVVGLEVKERQEPGYTSLAFTECGERTTGCFEYGGTVMGSELHFGKSTVAVG